MCLHCNYTLIRTRQAQQYQVLPTVSTPRTIYMVYTFTLQLQQHHSHSSSVPARHQVEVVIRYQVEVGILHLPTGILQAVSTRMPPTCINHRTGMKSVWYDVLDADQRHKNVLLVPYTWCTTQHKQTQRHGQAPRGSPSYRISTVEQQ